MIDNLKEDLANVWAGLSDRWKATLRSTWQSIVGAALLGVLVLLSAATNLLNGGDVDLLAEASNAARLFALALLGGFTGVVTFAMNRKDAPKYGSD